MRPAYPLYIPTKSRWGAPYTMAALHHLGLPFHAVVEPQQVADYAPVVEKYGGTVLPLDPEYVKSYDACMELPDGASRGPGPARNMAWDHSIEQGFDWHWVMDDNITAFQIFNANRKMWAGDGTLFAAMEHFVARYVDIGMAGPNYDFFVPARQRKAPYTHNTRIYSCNLIRNDLPFRWRGRYNEDTDLSLRILKAGYDTIMFNVFLQKKLPTQQLGGGNTAEFYAIEGTARKSLMLVAMHPDVTRPVKRFGREHHYVDYSSFQRRALRLRPDVEIPKEPVFKFTTRDRPKLPKISRIGLAQQGVPDA